MRWRWMMSDVSACWDDRPLGRQAQGIWSYHFIDTERMLLSLHKVALFSGSEHGRWKVKR